MGLIFDVYSLYFISNNTLLFITTVTWYFCLFSTRYFSFSCKYCNIRIRFISANTTTLILVALLSITRQIITVDENNILENNIWKQYIRWKLVLGMLPVFRPLKIPRRYRLPELSNFGQSEQTVIVCLFFFPWLIIIHEESCFIFVNKYNWKSFFQK